MLKRSLIALSLISILTGCSLDGDDGQDGTQGVQGEQGTAGQNGTNGINANSVLNISLVGRAVLNAQSPEGAAEIVAYQASKKWIYAINSSGDEAVVNIIPADTFDTAALVQDNEGIVSATNLTSAITLTLNDNTPGDANSIAIDKNNQLLAVAMAAKTVGEVGQIAFYNISGDTPVFIKNVTAGFLPDMVTFSHNGTKVVVANEGEPNGDYSIDPEGSISVINIENGVIADTATNIDFTAYNNQQTELEEKGLVFANPTGRTINGNEINTTVAMDLEPEYVSISKDNKYAYISIQENNALAIVNLEDNSLELKGLGFKSWSNLQIDASDKDGGVNFKSYPGLYGMYQPDTISSFSWKGANFDYLNNDDNDIGRLKVSTVKGDTNNDGQYDSLYAYGARSFTIWDSNGLVVFDSGDDIGRITASVHGEPFNNNEDENKGDSRSDDKGAEPEALTIGKIDDRTFAFVGLERMGGVMVYDITNPYDVQFEDYFYNRGVIEGADITGDLAPEGMVFVPAEQSATDKPLLIIGNEISGTIVVWQIAAN